MQHNEPIFRAEWRDDWKLVKYEERSLKRHWTEDICSIRDLINIYSLWCMYMLHLINDALGVYPNLPTTSGLTESPLEQIAAECLSKALRCLHNLRSHSSLGSPCVGYIEISWVVFFFLLPTPICHLQRQKRQAICSDPFTQSRLREKGRWFSFSFPEEHLVKNKVHWAHVFATSLTR